MARRRPCPRLLLAAAWCASLSGVAAAEGPSPGQAAQAAGPDGSALLRRGEDNPTGADFRGQSAAPDVQRLANWAITSADNQDLPFVIIDKINARVFVFDRDGLLTGSAPALLGLSEGDDSVPGIGQRKLAKVTPDERTTPAGRFVASLGRDLVQDILWIDYESSLSMHRVIPGKAKERRLERLNSVSSEDNRISYGCINVPAKFYDDVVKRAFLGTVGIVYILPETRSVESAFALPDARGGPAK